MKDKIIARELKCINDCMRLARVSLAVGNLKYARIMFEDALKSVNELERLNANETVVLIGTRLPSRNPNHN